MPDSLSFPVGEVKEAVLLLMQVKFDYRDRKNAELLQDHPKVLGPFLRAQAALDVLLHLQCVSVPSGNGLHNEEEEDKIQGEVLVEQKIESQQKLLLNTLEEYLGQEQKLALVDAYTQSGSGYKKIEVHSQGRPSGLDDAPHESLQQVFTPTQTKSNPDPHAVAEAKMKERSVKLSNIALHFSAGGNNDEGEKDPDPQQEKVGTLQLQLQLDPTSTEEEASAEMIEINVYRVGADPSFLRVEPQRREEYTKGTSKAVVHSSGGEVSPWSQFVFEHASSPGEDEPPRRGYVGECDAHTLDLATSEIAYAEYDNQSGGATLSGAQQDQYYSSDQLQMLKTKLQIFDRLQYKGFSTTSAALGEALAASLNLFVPSSKQHAEADSQQETVVTKVDLRVWRGNNNDIKMGDQHVVDDAKQHFMSLMTPYLSQLHQCTSFAVDPESWSVTAKVMDDFEDGVAATIRPSLAFFASGSSLDNSDELPPPIFLRIAPADTLVSDAPNEKRYSLFLENVATEAEFDALLMREAPKHRWGGPTGALYATGTIEKTEPQNMPGEKQTCLPRAIQRAVRDLMTLKADYGASALEDNGVLSDPGSPFLIFLRAQAALDELLFLHTISSRSQSPLLDDEKDTLAQLGDVNFDKIKKDAQSKLVRELEEYLKQERRVVAAKDVAQSAMEGAPQPQRALSLELVKDEDTDDLLKCNLDDGALQFEFREDIVEPHGGGSNSVDPSGPVDGHIRVGELVLVDPQTQTSTPQATGTVTKTIAPSITVDIRVPEQKNHRARAEDAVKSLPGGFTSSTKYIFTYTENNGEEHDGKHPSPSSSTRAREFGVPCDAEEVAQATADIAYARLDAGGEVPSSSAASEQRKREFTSRKNKRIVSDLITGKTTELSDIQTPSSALQAFFSTLFTSAVNENSWQEYAQRSFEVVRKIHEPHSRHEVAKTKSNFLSHLKDYMLQLHQCELVDSRQDWIATATMEDYGIAASVRVRDRRREDVLVDPPIFFRIVPPRVPEFSVYLEYPEEQVGEEEQKGGTSREQQQEDAFRMRVLLQKNKDSLFLNLPEGGLVDGDGPSRAPYSWTGEVLHASKWCTRDDIQMAVKELVSGAERDYGDRAIDANAVSSKDVPFLRAQAALDELLFLATLPLPPRSTSSTPSLNQDEASLLGEQLSKNVATEKQREEAGARLLDNLKQYLEQRTRAKEGEEPHDNRCKLLDTTASALRVDFYDHAHALEDEASSSSDGKDKPPGAADGRVPVGELLLGEQVKKTNRWTLLARGLEQKEQTERQESTTIASITVEVAADSTSSKNKDMFLAYKDDFSNSLSSTRGMNPSPTRKLLFSGVPCDAAEVAMATREIAYGATSDDPRLAESTREDHTRRSRNKLKNSDLLLSRSGSSSAASHLQGFVFSKITTSSDIEEGEPEQEQLEQTPSLFDVYANGDSVASAKIETDFFSMLRDYMMLIHHCEFVPEQQEFRVTGKRLSKTDESVRAEVRVLDVGQSMGFAEPLTLRIKKRQFEATFTKMYLDEGDGAAMIELTYPPQEPGTEAPAWEGVLKMSSGPEGQRAMGTRWELPTVTPPPERTVPQATFGVAPGDVWFEFGADRHSSQASYSSPRARAADVDSFIETLPTTDTPKNGHGVSLSPQHSLEEQKNREGTSKGMIGLARGDTDNIDDAATNEHDTEQGRFSVPNAFLGAEGDEGGNAEEDTEEDSYTDYWHRNFYRPIKATAAPAVTTVTTAIVAFILYKTCIRLRGYFARRVAPVAPDVSDDTAIENNLYLFDGEVDYKFKHYGSTSTSCPEAEESGAVTEESSTAVAEESTAVAEDSDVTAAGGLQHGGHRV